MNPEPVVCTPPSVKLPSLAVETHVAGEPSRQTETPASPSPLDASNICALTSKPPVVMGVPADELPEEGEEAVPLAADPLPLVEVPVLATPPAPLLDVIEPPDSAPPASPPPSGGGTAGAPPQPTNAATTTTPSEKCAPISRSTAQLADT